MAQAKEPVAANPGPQTLLNTKKGTYLVYQMAAVDVLDPIKDNGNSGLLFFNSRREPVAVAFWDKETTKSVIAALQVSLQNFPEPN